MEGMISQAEAQDFLDAAAARLHATTNELLQTQAALSKEKRASIEKDKRIAELESKLASLSEQDNTAPASS